jgi:hypothetical protein
MADISDVYNALTSLIQTALYPAGPPSPNQASPVTGTVCRYYPGWPQKAQLDADIAAGLVNISVFNTPGYRNTTRYPWKWQRTVAPTITLTATVDGTGTEVTIGGTVTTPQNVAIITNGVGVSYAVQSGDTLTSIAAALASALTTAGVSATSSGAVVTVPSAHSLVARVGGVSTVAQEKMREERRFQIDFWCPTPALRDAASTPVKLAVASLHFLALADGSNARIITASDMMDDESAKAVIYRRTLTYLVEYPTIAMEQVAEAIVLETQIQGGEGPTSDFTPTDPPPFTIQS